MFKQFYWKRRKILTGLVWTRHLKKGFPYDPTRWWDAVVYADGISDRRTISSKKGPLATVYHYASVEQIITRHFQNAGVSLEGWRVFDIGSGAGHWLDFYRRIGASHCTGCDISSRSVEFLRQKYAGDSTVALREGPFSTCLAPDRAAYDLINAIGVMFHVVDDAEWERGLAVVAQALRPGGYLVVGGHFGWFDGINVQADAQGAVNKRLRSRSHWKRVLRGLGFRNISFHFNPAYLFINDTLPENNILIARR